MRGACDDGAASIKRQTGRTGFRARALPKSRWRKSRIAGLSFESPQMKQLFIHIGMHKTGTTAIQTSLRINRKNLGASGVFAPKRVWMKNDLPENRAHHDLARALSRPGLVGGDGDRIISEYYSLLDNTDKDIAILSSENFCILDSSAIEKLAKSLPPARTRIIVYIRDQIDWIESMLNQMIKRSGVADIDAAFQDLLKRIDYYSMLRSWEDAFGKDNITVKLYDDSLDVIEEFYSIIGVRGMSVPTRRNIRFTREALQLMLVANSVHGHDGEIEKFVRRIQRNSKWSDYGSLLSSEQLQLVAGKSKEINRRIWERYLPAGTPMFPEPANPADRPRELRMDTVAQTLFFAWKTEHALVQDLERRVKRLEESLQEGPATGNEVDGD